MTGPLAAPIYALGWGLLQFLWQGLVLLLAVKLAGPWLRRVSPAVRYRASLAAFFLLSLLPLCTTLVAFHEFQVLSSVHMTGAAPPAVPVASTAGVQATLTGWLPQLLLFALAGAGVFLAWTTGGWIRLRRLIRSGRPARLAPGALAGLGNAHPRPTLLEAEGVDAPLVAGWRRPVILLPRGITGLMPEAELRLVLSHELAHVRRRDYAINLLQRVIEAVLWFQPAVWLLSATVRREREHCCDEEVIRSGGRPLALARALVNLAGIRSRGTTLACAVAAGDLSQRIRRLAAQTAGSDAAPGRLRALMTAGLLVLTTACAAGLGARAAAIGLGNSLPVVTIHAEDPAGRFMLQMQAGQARSVALDDAIVPPERLVQHGRTLTILNEAGRAELTLTVRPDGVSWKPRPPRPS